MADIKDSKNWGFETRQLHIGQEQADPVTDARAVPIYASTSYVFHNSQHAADRFGLRDAGNIYGRLTNPTETVSCMLRVMEHIGSGCVDRNSSCVRYRICLFLTNVKLSRLKTPVLRIFNICHCFIPP